MKRTTLIIGLASLVVGLMLVSTTVSAQGTYMNRYIGGCWDCGWYGNNNMMGMNRMMMGSGAMHQGAMGYWDDCGNWMGHMSGYNKYQGPWQDMRYDAYGRLMEPLTEKQAKEISQYYIDSTGNPNLKVGKISEKSNVFEASIVTKDNSLVNKLLIDKQTGAVQPQVQ